MFYNNILNKFLIINKIIKHNNYYFKHENNSQTDDSKILVEFNNFTSNHVGTSYLANELKKIYKSKLIAYFGHVLLTYPLERNLIFKIKLFLGKLFSINFFGTYKSFGVENFFYPKYSSSLENKKNKIYKDFLHNVKTLKKFEKFKINNILVGDLMYDTYLKKNYDIIPTIDLSDKKFKKFIKDFISLFLIWENYFNKNKVKAVITSHTVYTLAIPLRIAVHRGIEAFCLAPEFLRRIKKNSLYLHNEIHFLKKIFNKIDIKKKQIIIKKSSEKIANRIKGLYSSDYPYVTKSAFGQTSKKNYIHKSNKIKFLIATHDFVDGPHSMGNHLFPDFYQWFKFLCKVSEKTNYFWYVKTHPNFGGDWTKYIKYEREVVKKTIKKYKNITLLPKNITHNQIAREGINAVFTVHGTVGLDYALLKIPTINASLNNPHINYKFNYHPKSIRELESFIFNFKKKTKNYKVNNREILEYYSMKNIFFSKDWLFQDFDKTLKEVGGYHEVWKLEFYNYWIKMISKEKHHKISKDIRKFINSKNHNLLNNNNLGTF